MDVRLQSLFILLAGLFSHLALAQNQEIEVRVQSIQASFQKEIAGEEIEGLKFYTWQEELEKIRRGLSAQEIELKIKVLEVSAEIAIQLMESEKALVLLKEATELREKSSLLTGEWVIDRALMGLLYLDLGQEELAVKLYLSLAQNFSELEAPEQVKSGERLGQYMSRFSHYLPRSDCENKIQKMWTDTLRVHLLRGRALALSGELELARKFYNDLQASPPENYLGYRYAVFVEQAQLYMGLAQAYFAQGELKEATLFQSNAVLVLEERWGVSNKDILPYLDFYLEILDKKPEENEQERRQVRWRIERMRKEQMPKSKHYQMKDEAY